MIAAAPMPSAADAQLAKATPAHAAKATRRRAIIEQWERFRAKALPIPRVRFPEFVDVLFSLKIIPGDGVKTVSLRSLDRWMGRYHRSGLSGLLPQYAKRGRKRSRIGGAAWAHFVALVGDGQSVCRAYWLTRREVIEHRGHGGTWTWPGLSTVRRRWEVEQADAVQSGDAAGVTR